MNTDDSDGEAPFVWRAAAADSPPVSVRWHSSLDDIPNENPLLLVGHEFLDALPIHQFCRTDKGWRERMVDVREHTAEARRWASPVRSRSDKGHEAAASAAAQAVPIRNLDEDSRVLDFVLAPSPTPASALFAPELPGDAEQAEVCPAARAFTKQAAKRIRQFGGAALLIDYGDDRPPPDTLRGILQHRFVHPLHLPGEVDLSADVDFSALRRVVRQASPELRCPPLSTQRDFLGAMGLEHRVRALLRTCTPPQRQALIEGAMRLVDEAGMGTAYKVFAFSHVSLGAQLPGFLPSSFTEP